MYTNLWKISVIIDLKREVTTDRCSTVSLFQFKCSVISKRTVHDGVLKKKLEQNGATTCRFIETKRIYSKIAVALPPNKTLHFSAKNCYNSQGFFLDILEFSVHESSAL